MALLSVVVPVWKDVDLLERLLMAIRAKTEEPYEVIISESETPEVEQSAYVNYIRSMTNIPLSIISTPPEGHNIAVEKGLGVAKGDFLMWVDVDVVPPKDWWTKIKRVFDSDERIGLVSPMMYPRWDQYVLALHGIPPRLLKLELLDGYEMTHLVERRDPEWFDLPITLEQVPDCVRYYGYPPEGLKQWDYSFEGFTVMRRKCYDEVGAYAKNPSGGTEVNISRNARSKGWRIVAAHRVLYWHCDSYPECIGFGRAFRRRGKRVEVI